MQRAEADIELMHLGQCSDFASSMRVLARNGENDSVLLMPNDKNYSAQL
jgi:hypothetical protein